MTRFKFKKKDMTVPSQEHVWEESERYPGLKVCGGCKACGPGSLSKYLEWSKVHTAWRWEPPKDTAIPDTGG